MPEVIDTLSIIRAIPFEKVESRINIKAFLLNQWDTSVLGFTQDDKLEMEQIIWTAYASISQRKTEENLMLAASQRGTSKEDLPADVEAEVYKRTKKEMKADEWPDAPLEIVAETARKIEPYILKRFQIPRVNSPALAPKPEEHEGKNTTYTKNQERFIRMIQAHIAGCESEEQRQYWREILSKGSNSPTFAEACLEEFDKGDQEFVEEGHYDNPQEWQRRRDIFAKEIGEDLDKTILRLTREGKLSKAQALQIAEDIAKWADLLSEAETTPMGSIVSELEDLSRSYPALRGVYDLARGKRTMYITIRKAVKEYQGDVWKEAAPSLRAKKQAIEYLAQFFNQAKTQLDIDWFRAMLESIQADADFAQKFVEQTQSTLQSKQLVSQPPPPQGKSEAFIDRADVARVVQQGQQPQQRNSDTRLEAVTHVDGVPVEQLMKTPQKQQTPQPQKKKHWWQRWQNENEMEVSKRKKTPQEFAREVNAKYCEIAAQYDAGRITLDQMTQRIYEVLKTIPSQYFLDPDFVAIENDRSCMSPGGRIAFAPCSLEAAKRLRAESQAGNP
jgi:hypothetical protein